MGKVLRPILQFAAVAVNFIPGIGQIASLAISAGLTLAAGAIKTGGRAGTSLTPFDPKSVNPDPTAPRKLVFGRTTFPVDLRYAEPSGTNQEFIDYIFALAAHRSDAIEEIYIEDDLAWTSGGGAQGKYAGYLTVEVILEAGSGAFHTVNAGTTWGSTRRMTGCTTMKVRIKRSDNNKNSQSPFANGINGRWAVIGRGIPVYDPALDSTVAGGSGTQRVNNQATWAYTAGSVARGNNPALQLLTYLIGWRIGGVVSVGCGIPADAIDLQSFGVAAALCDESVALASGGSQRRFEAGRAFADSDDPLAVINVLLSAMNGELVDDGGRLSLRIAVNDLTATVTLTDDDFVSGYQWRPAPPISQQYTVVRGRFSQPSAPTLYGLADYPEVTIPRTSLAPRPLTLELSAVQEQRRAQRIANQAAQRNLYLGEFEVTLGIRGWQLRRNQVVAVTSSARGWTAKLFRVRSLTFNTDGTVDALMREENAAIYAWSASESAVVTPVVPVVFDSRAASSWLMAGIEAEATRNVPRGAYNNATAYELGDEVIFAGSTYRLKVATSTGNAPPDATRWDLVAAIGEAGIAVIVSNEAHVVSTATDGSGGVYTAAGGTMSLLRGATPLAPVFSIAALSPASPTWITINATTGVYTVTDPGVDTATATLRAAFGGVNYDRVYTLAKSKGGATGAQGPALQLTADSQAFTYTDGAANPGSQTINLTAALSGVSGTVTWTTSPTVTLTGTGNSRALSIANFGTNRQVTVTATLGALSDRVTIVRLERDVVAPNAANRVPFSRMENNRGWAAAASMPGGVTGLVYFSFEGLRAVVGQATASAAGQALFVMPSPLDDPLIKVQPGERLSISFRAGALNASSWQMSFRYRRADNTLNEVFVASGTTYNWTVDRQTIFFDVPSDARLGTLKLYVFSAAAGACEVLISEPMIASAVTGQTLHPTFTPGPNASDGADVTRDTLPNLQRGEWASGVNYALGDIVTRNGSSYTCIIAHTSNTGNQPLGTNWSLLSAAGAQGPTGVSAPPIKALGTGGAAQLDPIRLTAGQTLTVDAALFLNTGGVAGVCSMQVQWSINGANSWTTMTNGSASDSQPTTEPVELTVPNATFTNSSGIDQLYDIRVTSTRQSRTVNQPLSYMRAV